MRCDQPLLGDGGRRVRLRMVSVREGLAVLPASHHGILKCGDSVAAMASLVVSAFWTHGARSGVPAKPIPL